MACSAGGLRRPGSLRSSQILNESLMIDVPIGNFNLILLIILIIPIVLIFEEQFEE